MSNQGKKGVDPFRQLLIGEVDKLGTQHGQDWGNRLRSEHAMEMGAQGPKGGITAQMLTQQRNQLKKVMSVGTPWANNLEIVRDGTHATHGSGADFADFVQQTRAHLSTIASTGSGQDLFRHIGNANKRFAARHPTGIDTAGPSQLDAAGADELAGTVGHVRVLRYRLRRGRRASHGHGATLAPTGDGAGRTDT
jgi:hypothetical protein